MSLTPSNCAHTMLTATKQNPRVLPTDTIPSTQRWHVGSSRPFDGKKAPSHEIFRPMHAYPAIKTMHVKNVRKGGNLEMVHALDSSTHCSQCGSLLDDESNDYLLLSENDGQQRVRTAMLCNSPTETARSRESLLLLNVELVKQTYAGHEFDAQFSRRPLSFNFEHYTRNQFADLTLDLALIEETFMDLEITENLLSRHESFGFDEVSELST